MRTTITLCLLFLCRLALMGQARIGANPDYNPTNPADPQVPVITYTLHSTASPANGGSTNRSSATKYAAGTSVYMSASAQNGFSFVNWTKGDSVVSSSRTFYYTMPAEDIELCANFIYNPSNPADPDSMAVSYKLTIEAQPKNAGSFNISSTTVQEGTSTRLYAYTNTGYRFKGWQMGDSILSTSSPCYYTMGNKNAHIVGVFEYNPSNPGNPGKNSWNAATGEVIVDDFSAGNLYNAIYNAIGDNSSSDVTMITVAGRMNSNDFGIANNYSNCNYLDLSRTHGYTAIPSYAYDYNTTLTKVILPAGIETIEYRAFYRCSNLSEVTCYAITPPALENNAFTEIAEGAILRVLSSSIPLYSEAEGWKNFVIMPLSDEVRSLEISLPEGSEDGKYKNMTLELINAETGQKQKYVISDRTSYTFNGLLRNSVFNVYVKNSTGTVLGEINDITIADENVSVKFESLAEPKNVTLSIVTPDKNDVTSQTQITWSDQSGTYLKQGNTLTGFIEGTTVNIRTVLPQTLGMQYVAPADAAYTISSNGNNLQIVLNPIPQAVLQGTIKDIATGSVISDAVISVSQKLNGKYSKAFTAKSDRNGKFILTVFDAPSTITASSSDHISKTVELQSLTDTVSIDDIALKSITGAIISLAFTYTESVAEGETPEIQEFYNDYANVSYTIYNKTQKRPVTQFNVQYPKIVLLEEVAEGDELLITANSINNSFTPVSSVAVVDATNNIAAEFDIVQQGGIKASFGSTENSNVSAILYNAKGELQKRYSYISATIEINDLQDGNYTLVSMGNSNLFNSVYNLSQLAATGLKENNDYIKNNVTVKSGTITTIHNETVPLLDESKLYYTGDYTSFSVNKSSIVAGNYLTLKGKIDFKAAYSSKADNVNMVIDLPESASFVENSVMVGTKISSYTLDGNRLTVPLGNNYTEQVRFCIIPTLGGSYAPNAFAQFTLEEKEILQPIGSANYEVKDLSITVPSTVAKTSIPVNGTAIGGSTVKIYDGEMLIGETTALANGIWATTCELNEPYNLSTHQIYAKVTTKQGLELQSETQECFYDKNAVQIKTVNMSFYNGWLRKTVEVLFDFNNPQGGDTSYMFYTTTDFTFVADLTNNSPEVVSNVIIYVYTDNNNIIPLSAKYDEKQDKWVAVNKFSWGNLPVNISVDFSSKTELVIDNNLLDKTNKDIENIFADIDLTYKEEIKLIDELQAEIQKENYSLKQIDYLLNIICKTENNSNIKLTQTQETFVNNTSNYLNEIPYNNVDKALEKSIENIGKPFNTPLIIESKELNNGIKTPRIEIIPNENNERCVMDNSWEIADDFDYFKNEVTFLNNNGDKISINFQDIKNLPTNDKSYADFATYENELYSNVSSFWGPYSDLLGFAEVAYKGDKLLNNNMLSKLQLEGINKANIDKWLKILNDRKHIVGGLANLEKAGKVLGPLGVGVSLWDTGSSSWGIWKDNKNWDKLRDAISAACTKEAANELNNKLENYRKWLQNRNWRRTTLKGVSTCMNIAGVVAAPETLGFSLALFAAGIGIGKLTDFYEKKYQQTNNDNWEDLLNDVKNKGGECSELPGFENYDDKHPPFNPKNPIHDPSGYVYEAVSSNRLQGVTATCYYKEMVEDMYGDLHENVVLWDAAEYAQENPLFTDENGMYRWDVPQGLWQVKFEKEGYQTTYSEWLPVPPPQLEVNVGMVQSRQPEVLSARAYEDGIEIAFDKYMQPELLDTTNIFVTKNGETAAGSIKLLDEEQAYTDDKNVYASKLRFIPETSFLTTDEVILTVSRKVKSYAGVQMESDYTQEFDIEKEIKSIVADSLVQVEYGRGKEITISALPYDAAIGKSLIVRSASSMIVSVDADTILFDNDGKAKIRLTGELPGTSVIKFSLIDATTTAETTVEVGNFEPETTAAPVASRVSGTAVYRNSTVSLDCETEDAVIYYTLDGSCPCDASAQRYIYEQPIVIAHDSMIVKAMAIAPDMYESDIVELHYTLRKNTLGMKLNNGWNWVSHNLESDLPASKLQQSTERIVAQTEEIINDPDHGWVGTLDSLCPENTYKVYANSDTTYAFSGYAFNANDSIPLQQGLNWIGYPVEQIMSVSEAFANSQPDDEDYIVGREGFTQYTDGKWIGTLTTMEPGKGYLYHSKSDKAIVYNTAIVSKASSLYANGLTNNTPWAIDKNRFPNIMCLIADVNTEGYKADEDTYCIGAFYENECRGIGEYIDGKLMMSIYGDGNETITFRAVANDDETMRIIEEKVKFEETLLGSLAAPYQLHIGAELTGINEFNSENISISVQQGCMYIHSTSYIEMLSLTDVFGNTVLRDDNVQNGESIGIADLNTGVYIATIKLQKNVLYKKIMIVNNWK